MKAQDGVDSLYIKNIAPACFIASRSVTQKERARILGRVVDAGRPSTEEEEESANDAAVDSGMEASNNNNNNWKAMALVASGLALTQPSPSNCAETVAAVRICRGNVLYYADWTDLQRGEGLWDTLAPAMEQVLLKKEKNVNRTNIANNNGNGSDDPASVPKAEMVSSPPSTLYVLLDDASNKKQVQSYLERATKTILPNLIGAGPEQTTLEDVFSQVVYLTPEEAVASILAKASETTAATAVWDAGSNNSIQSQSTGTTSGEWTTAECAVARQLGPILRAQLDQTLTFCKDACTDSENGSMKLVVDFGSLCDAAVKEAEDAIVAASAATSNLFKTKKGQQLRDIWRADLDAGLSDLFSSQLDLFQKASLEEFKRGLSKLLISPNLQSDMEAVASKSRATFATASRKLVARSLVSSSSSTWNTEPSKIAYTRKLKDYVANRILTARASGKFRPLPRKGFTLGFHWLLPKPFGNDYRQEPWMVHATDNMVYVPPNNKLADVNPNDVASGDWRDKIVPSPAGNDMLYMQ